MVVLLLNYPGSGVDLVKERGSGFHGSTWVNPEIFLKKIKVLIFYIKN